MGRTGRPTLSRRRRTARGRRGSRRRRPRASLARCPGRPQLPQRRGTGHRDSLHVAVGQHDVGRHLVPPRALEPPRPQRGLGRLGLGGDRLQWAPPARRATALASPAAVTSWRSWDAEPSRSVRNGDGRLTSASSTARWRARVMATWSTRRSSSTSSASRWGKPGGDAEDRDPVPLLLDPVHGREGDAAERRLPWKSTAATARRSAGPGGARPPAERLQVVEVAGAASAGAGGVEQAMAPPSPIWSFTTASASRVVPVCTASVTSRRSSAAAGPSPPPSGGQGGRRCHVAGRGRVAREPGNHCGNPREGRR